jgi:3-hydroxybenzoate 6-monooxygenase
MSNTPDYDFVIVGGGISGLAAALALAQIGRTSLVLEKSNEPQFIGAGIQLGPNALRAIEQLSIREELSPFLSFPDEIRLNDGLTGKNLASIPLKDQFVIRYGFPYSVAHRGDLLRVMLTNCQRSPLIRLESSAEDVTFDDHDLGVEANWSGNNQAVAKALIGADGLWSGVRKHVLSDSRPKFSGHVAFRALINPSAAPEWLTQNNSVNWMAPGAHLVHYPVCNGDKINIVAVCKGEGQKSGWNNAPDLNLLNDGFKSFIDPIKSFVRHETSWRSWPLFDRIPVDKMVEDNVALIGDAAHPMLPYFAQGAAMALEDATGLSQAVADNGDDMRLALAAYQECRVQRVSTVQKHSSKLGKIYHTDGFVRTGRNLVLSIKSEKQLLNSLNWVYAKVQ